MSDFIMEKTYDPQRAEDAIYADWMEKGYFEAKLTEGAKTFSMAIPPPNITGQLHMGHALVNTLHDIVARYKRMDGYDTLWLPGTDHASIATEAKIVEAMREEGISKEDIGRDKFLERAWEWKAEYGGRITAQLKKLGSSLDWSRERFTMDEGCSIAVKKVFVDLYNKDLIYRGNRIINWCPTCMTSISDSEVEHEDKAGHFWHIKYTVKDSEENSEENSEEYVIIATTRPETMLGDTAVAVHPDDARYTHLIGKMVILPLMNREIPIIADEYVDMEFGTGALKITPAHDPNDFMVGQKHNLPQIRIMNDDGTINEEGGKYCGLDRYEARRVIVEDLTEQGLLIKVEDHNHSVGQCYRCNTVIEPITSLQWFVTMEPLAKPAIKAVRDGDIRFIPKRFEKMYYNWMENIHDWCISRQLWWGHRIPAYYCDDCGYTMVSETEPDGCGRCNSLNITQDEDVLDTWFSSALWPFSTLGWPEDTPDLRHYYPTSTLITGYDIIPLWVARMIFSGIEHMGKIPFSDVYINGIVRDSEGRKMSKSLGNGIDPLEIIADYGADALRLSLVIGNSPGNDMRFRSEKVESCRNFANKVWNASRFILMNMDNLEISNPQKGEMTVVDRWITSRINTVIKDVTDNIDKYDLGLAVQKVYDFIWDEFCDWYIEMVKPRLYGQDVAAREHVLWCLTTVLGDALKLLHPFMPFITEEIWGYLPAKNSSDQHESIMMSPWPKHDDDKADPTAEMQINHLMEGIKAIRNLRAEMDVPANRKTKILLLAGENISKDEALFIKSCDIYFQRLAQASELEIITNDSIVPENAASLVTSDYKIFIPMEDLVDFEKEEARLTKEIERLEGEIKRAGGKLKNKNFTDKAPQKVVDAEKEKLEKYTTMIEQVRESLGKLEALKG